MKLTRPVCVVVPVFNGRVALQALVESLARSHPEPSRTLSFLFLDDASTDEAVSSLLASHPFFGRADVRRHHRTENGGFVRTANQGMTLARPEGDVLLLNADTQVHGNAIHILQQVALRYPRIGSVTPLTNNGSIASLWRFPDGVTGELDWDPGELTQCIETARCQTPLHGAPTGVGLCMYIARQALDEVGLFDEVTFGRGYGEENDWCQRAVAKGFIHLICTETYVHHEGTQSFTDAEKTKQLEENLVKLGRRYPAYHEDVQRYLRDDPLASTRATLTWRISRMRKRKQGFASVALLLHRDPEHLAGGTERHVQMLGAELLEKGHEVFFLFQDAGGWRLRIRQPGVKEPLHDYLYPEPQFAPLFQQLMEESSLLHVHHLHGASRHVLSQVAQANVPRKLFTAHDYWTLCPSINLLNERGRYCELPEDAASCNRCLSGHHGYHQERIEDYRERTRGLLSAFDEVLVPSESARAVLDHGFKGGVPVRVVANMLPFSGRLPEDGPALPPRRKLIFLGALGEAKGMRLLKSAERGLRASGFQIEVWGFTPAWARWSGVQRGYSSWRELWALGEEERPFAVCLPFVWPETFSFTTYEAICALGVPVVVGPWGHPARLVADEGLGVVMREATPEALLQSVQELIHAYSRIAARVRVRRRILADVLSGGALVEAVLQDMPVSPRIRQAKDAWSLMTPQQPRAGAGGPDMAQASAAALRAAERWFLKMPGGAHLWRQALGLGGWLLRNEPFRP